MKKQNKSQQKPSPENKKLNIWEDILGIVLILSVPMFYYICIKSSDSGIIGNSIAFVIKSLFGLCRFVFPIYILYSGFYIIFKNNKFFSKEVSTFNFFATKSFIGVTVLFLSIVTLFGISSISRVSAEEIGLTASNGGIIGHCLGFIFSKLFGKTVYYILSIFIIVSIVLTANFNYKAFKEKRKPAETVSEEKETSIKSIQKTLPEPTEQTGETKSKDTLLDILNREQEEKDKKPKNKKTEKEENTEFTFSKIKKNLDFKLPPSSLLNSHQGKKEQDNTENIKNIKTIEDTLSNFNIDAEVLNVSDGPTVSRYEIKLADGIRVSKIISLADNLAMSLAAIDVRVEAPIPGKSAIGVEVPKAKPSMVTLREIIEDPGFQKAKGALTFAIGKDVADNSIYADLAKMPHLLIGGATNSGKSVGLNTLIASILYRMTPDEVRFVMVDPKRVELSLYDGIPHLACPVIKDAKLAAGALKAVENEMDSRYKILEKSMSRNIESYNSKVDPEDKMSYMIIVIDELADLMMQCAKDVENSICRIAQLARAVGIHLVIATQRPSVDVITGKIKANIASRIAFAVSSHHDSRTILDSSGAERLIGRGDMLFHPITENKPMRVQGCYLSEEEIESLVSYLKDQRETVYCFEPVAVSDSDTAIQGDMPSDDLWEDVVRFVVRNGYCSTSTIQRHFKIGYNRAGSLVDMMEAQGIVSPLNGAKPRDVLITETDLENMIGKNNE